MSELHSGYIALVGRPNVGKSTLMNQILGKKIAITSSKPQTTRHRMLGIKSMDNIQMVFVDTPGLHKSENRALNRYMNRVAKAAMQDVDIVLFMVEALQWQPEDQWVCSMLKALDKPVILVINKVDRVKDKAKLLPFIDNISAQANFIKTIPISALDALQVDVLQDELIKLLPDDKHYFPPDQFSDRSDRFVVSEIIREKLMRRLHDELPYAITVTIEAFEEEDDIIRLAAVIWVERQSHKHIVIGKGGAMLKLIGKQAREDMEVYFKKKVFLQTWVKIKSNWADDEKSLHQFGYDE